MGIYRTTRALEASIIDYLTTELKSQWSDINIEKSFSKVYKISLPVVCARIGVTDYTWAEIGSNSLIRKPTLLIDIFGTSFGNTLDIKDFLIEKLKVGCVFYNYVISNGVVDSKTASGRIRFLSLSDNPINFEDSPSELSVHDRFRWLITGEISTGKVE